MNIANGKYYVEVDLDLATRDNYLRKIENQIMAKRQLLLNKQSVLQKISKRNHFLNEVQKDYLTYYNFIVKQKQGQIRSMNIINQYLNDIIVSGKFTKEDIYEAKNEQKHILGEINHVKRNLNDIITQTNCIDNNTCIENRHINAKQMQTRPPINLGDINSSL